ncbi:MAG: penicillin-binding protein 2 [Acidimicrobiales bacterium]|nr:penicillin-binding protein 2 [Acidimicrobiales bacterium]
MNPDSPRLRLSVLGVVTFSLFAALFARLWYLQVMANDEFQVAAEANRIRVVAVEAPRGRILDRDGQVIVDNRVSVQVTVDRSVLGELEPEERHAVLSQVADGMARSGIPSTVEVLEERIADDRFSPYVPVPVAGDVPEDLKIWIDEHADELPSVAANRVAVRHYPYGQLAGHVVGYTGKISKEEVDSVTRELAETKPYTLNDEIGKSGIERLYESELRGTPGVRRIEVDVDGDPVRIIDEDPPAPGDDIVLNLDIDVQAVAEQALQGGLERARQRSCNNCEAPSVGAVGSTVVLDPHDGDVLAMASFPTFSPADLVDGISGTEWSFLNDRANRYPLNNWALQGQYAPGSTFKPFTAQAALKAGLIQPNTVIYDDGVYEVPGCRGDSCRFSNDNSKAFGNVDLRKSLTVSSDFYYYDLGARFWIDQDNVGGPEAMADRLKEWGFHADTGIDLPSEQSGRIPSPEWLRTYCDDVGTCSEDDRAWRTGKSVNMAIGQGEVLVTPLQLASAYATLANGGTRWVPQVVREVRDGVTREVKRTIEPKKAGTVEMAPDWRQAMIDGLVGVTTEEGGTALGAFRGFPSDAFPVAAKTGTAQVNNKAPTALFAAFGPRADPSFAVSVLLEESGYGGATAAPVARRLFDVLSGTEPLPPASPGGALPVDTQLSPDPGDVRD